MEMILLRNKAAKKFQKLIEVRKKNVKYCYEKVVECFNIYHTYKFFKLF